MDKIDDALIDLVSFTVDLGIDSARDGQLVPFVVTQKDSERKLFRFVADTLEEGMKKAQILCHVNQKGRVISSQGCPGNFPCPRV